MTSLLLFLALGCSGAATGPETAADRVAVELQLTPTRAEVPSGDSVQFEARAVDVAGEPVPGYTIDGNVVDDEVARVVDGGSVFTVVGLRRGATRFRATATNGETSEPLEAEADLEVEEESDGGDMAGRPARVAGLAATTSTDSSVTLVWTQVDDGTGAPADYAVRYGSPTIEWGSAFETERVVPGDDVGVEIELEFTGLEPGTEYEFRLVAFRGTLNEDAEFGELSNVAAASTEAAEGSGGGGEPAPSPSDGDAVFADGFEGGLAGARNGFEWGNSVNMSIVEGAGLNGTGALRLEFPPKPDGKDAVAQINLHFPDGVREVWIELYMKVPENYRHRDQQGPTNNKFFQVFGPDRSDSDVGLISELVRARDGSGSWIKGVAHRNEISPTNSGKRAPVQYNRKEVVIKEADAGRWQRWRRHIKVGTQGYENADGTLEVWQDQKKLIPFKFDGTDVTNEMWIRSFDGEVNELRVMRLLGWSNSGFDEATAFDFDGLKIFTADPGW